MPGLGVRFADEVQRLIELILENPMHGARVDGEVRRFLLRRFPFSVLYAVRAETLFILAVTHGSRRPGYWKTRSGG